MALAQFHMGLRPDIWEMPPQINQLGVSNIPALQERDIKGFLGASVPLREVIDINKLVDAKALREGGIDPGAVRIALGPSQYGSWSFPSLHLLVISVKDMFRDKEEAYMTIAHELAHHKQILEAEMTMEEEIEEVMKNELHAKRRHEISAIQVELRQAESFGWDVARYDQYLMHIYPENFKIRSGLPSPIRLEAEKKLEDVVKRQREQRAARREIGLPKNVSVRRHVRRRTFK